MAFRQRTTTFRPQLSVRRVYETVQPLSEIKENPQAFLLHIYIPGFPRENVRITYVGSSRMVRITGERPIQANRWSRFDQSYPIPENCEPEALQAKFETGVLILTMPKKATSQAAPEQPQVETTQEKGIADQPKPDEKGQETTSLQPPKKDEPIEYMKRATLPSLEKYPADLKATQEDTLPSHVSLEPIKDHSPQRGQGEVVQRLSPKVTGEHQIGEKEFEQKPTLATKMQTDEKAQKGQEEVEPKSTPTVETKTQIDKKLPKGQEEIESKPTIRSVTRKSREDKLQEDIGVKTTLAAGKEKLEEKKAEGIRVEDVEKERISKKEEEDFKKPSESGKPMKDKEKSSFKEKETRTKKLTTKEAEPSTPKVHKKKVKEGKSEEKVMDNEGNIETGDLVGSVTQVVTKIAQGKLDKEEKQLAVNVGAAVMVIAALGAYVLNRFAS